MSHYCKWGWRTGSPLGLLGPHPGSFSLAGVRSRLSTWSLLVGGRGADGAAAFRMAFGWNRAVTAWKICLASPPFSWFLGWRVGFAVVLVCFWFFFYTCWCFLVASFSGIIWDRWGKKKTWGTHHHGVPGVLRSLTNLSSLHLWVFLCLLYIECWGFLVVLAARIWDVCLVHLSGRSPIFHYILSRKNKKDPQFY